MKDQLGFGLRQRLREGYDARDFRADLKAGILVGTIAVPLAMAMAIATGVPPQYGLYTAILAGAICALLGGTRVQVTGPTAAMVVLVAPILKQFGFAGLLVATMMAGGILILMGIARLGRLLQMIPHPVTTGFTAGIAVVLALGQVHAFVGIPAAALRDSAGAAPDGAVEMLQGLWRARTLVSYADLGVGVLTLVLLLGLPRLVKRGPVPLYALVIGAIAAAIVTSVIADAHVATVGSTFSSTLGDETVRGIPPLPPWPGVPWHWTLTDGATTFHLDYDTLRLLLPSAFAIAMLGAIESLVTATIADGMCGSKHDPNAELIGLGVANAVVPFFGGIPATGGIVRTATNIRAGARSPLAAVIQAVFILACTIALAPLAAYLPMAALAALLLVVAKNVAEARHFVRLVRVAPRSDVLVLLTCFFLTVAFDLVIAVEVGVVLAAMLFMRRMAVLTKITLDTQATAAETPAGVRVYHIAGPMFFGAAKTAMQSLDVADAAARVVILEMQHVPVMDATGLVAMETLLDRLHRSGREVIIAGLPSEPVEMLHRAGIKRQPGRLAFAPELETAVSMAILSLGRLDAKR
ncbi:MAG: C4-dicarboxylic acid transporter DauA [Deltaproteobacteria bacterium]|nr:C4-dicarboxylic acid transporter DauA [Deltaproteobacteria bacterium]